MNEIQYRRDLWKLLPLVTLPGTQTVTQTVAGNAVEVGVAEGNFSMEMLNWPVHIPMVFMVDRWRQQVDVKGDSANIQAWHDANYLQVLRKVERLSDPTRAVILKGDSINMSNCVPNASLALVYIDGDHSFKGVMTDIKMWVPKLIHGGIMAFHDYENEAYGVRRAVQMFCNEYKIEIHRIPEDKWPDAGAWFQLPADFTGGPDANPV